MNYDSDMQEMMDKIASDMAENRGSYESGMRQIEGMGRGGSGKGAGEDKGDGDKGKFSGAVSFISKYFSANSKSALPLK